MDQPLQSSGTQPHPPGNSLPGRPRQDKMVAQISCRSQGDKCLQRMALNKPKTYDSARNQKKMAPSLIPSLCYCNLLSLSRGGPRPLFKKFATHYSPYTQVTVLKNFEICFFGLKNLKYILRGTSTYTDLGLCTCKSGNSTLVESLVQVPLM